MIVTCINGGLGNQMFQYAAGRSLADRLGESMQLDIRDLIYYRGKGQVHIYRLGPYPLRSSVAGGLHLAARGFFKSRKIRAFLADSGWMRGDYVREKEFAYRKLQAVPGRFTYLEGFWQSWKYFEDNRQRIIVDLTLPYEPKGENANLLKQMASGNSVCLHVRLGDYASSKIVSQAHGNLATAYYRKALRTITRKGGRFSYYLFSDEPQKAMNLFQKSLKIRVVDHNDGFPQEDMRLMSACRYFVTANSSFSWWGAWLSQRKGKRVVAPQKWFAGLKHDTRDLIPSDWIRI